MAKAERISHADHQLKLVAKKNKGKSKASQQKFDAPQTFRYATSFPPFLPSPLEAHRCDVLRGCLDLFRCLRQLRLPKTRPKNRP
jgi:hypothetical protein